MGDTACEETAVRKIPHTREGNKPGQSVYQQLDIYIYFNLSFDLNLTLTL
jgi:hypothetical protein